MIESSVAALRNAGQDVWVHLYVYNGPAQRRWKSGVFQSFAAMDLGVFRYKLARDRHLQAEYQKIVKSRIVPAAAYAVSLGAKVSVAPGLEDNLDDQGYRAALRLIREVMPVDVPVTYVRSSCYQCEKGVGRFRPPGVLLEEHDDKLFPLRWNGIVNTDGLYFRFSDEGTRYPPLQERLDSWLRRAEKQQNAFLLWIPHFQDAPPGLVPRPLNERNFRGPSVREQGEILDFLRS